MQHLTREVAEELFVLLQEGKEIDINHLIEAKIHREEGVLDNTGFQMKFDKKGRVRTVTYFPDPAIEDSGSLKQADERQVKQELREELMSEEERSKFSKNFYKRSFNKEHPAEPARLTTSANETTEEDETGGSKR